MIHYAQQSLQPTLRATEPSTLAAIGGEVPASSAPICLDWQFWSAGAAAVAIVLSQLPPFEEPEVGLLAIMHRSLPC
jgi:hypothetical protein